MTCTGKLFAAHAAKRNDHAKPFSIGGCYWGGSPGCWTMSNSLETHGFREVRKQLTARMKRDGLDTIKVAVTRASGKHKVDFTGSPEQVLAAKKVLAAWP